MRLLESDRSRQRLPTTVTIIVTALIVAPATALASHGFTDVRSGEFFHEAVDWMKDNDVTVGCNPPNNTEYCPNDFVTRGEMAVFLERLDTKDVFLRPGEVELEGGDADTLDGKDSSEFLGVTEKAANSDQLDGKDSGAFLGITGKAADSNLLDGMDSTALVPGAPLPTGTTLRGEYQMTNSQPAWYWFGHSWPGVLTGSLTSHYIDDDDPIPAECPGTVTAPEAAPGHICIFENSSDGGLDDVHVTTSMTGTTGTDYPFGFSLFKNNGGAAGAYAYGTWAMTVP